MNKSDKGRPIVREYLLSTHLDLITATLACADTVSDEGAIPLSERLADVLREQLDQAGIIEQLPAVLTGAVDAMDASLSVEPVAAPPYVVLANTGPLMRATIDSRRLVITIEAFRVRDRQYVRTSNDPAEVLSVEIRDHR